MKKPIALIDVRANYGTEAVYPANDTARLLCKLTGKKTFSHADLCTIEALGFVIEQQAKPFTYK